jgi:hypothetical protein
MVYCPKIHIVSVNAIAALLTLTSLKVKGKKILHPMAMYTSLVTMKEMVLQLPLAYIKNT